MAKSGTLPMWQWPFEMGRLATDMAETFWGATSVVNARMPMISAAFVNPWTANWPELNRMVTEKWDAFGRSGRSWSAGQRTMHRAIDAGARDLGRIAGGDVFGAVDWWTLAERNLDLWSTFAALPGEMLRPVRSKVVSNARRLGR